MSDPDIIDYGSIWRYVDISATGDENSLMFRYHVTSATNDDEAVPNSVNQHAESAFQLNLFNVEDVETRGI